VSFPSLAAKLSVPLPPVRESSPEPELPEPELPDEPELLVLT